MSFIYTFLDFNGDGIVISVYTLYVCVNVGCVWFLHRVQHYPSALLLFAQLLTRVVNGSPGYPTPIIVSQCFYEIKVLPS